MLSRHHRSNFERHFFSRFFDGKGDFLDPKGEFSEAGLVDFARIWSSNPSNGANLGAQEELGDRLQHVPSSKNAYTWIEPVSGGF